MSRMNHRTKKMFRELRAKNAVLKQEKEQLTIDLNQANYECERLSNEANYAQRDAEEASHQASLERERASRARRCAEEAESAAESKRWEQRRVTDELERARSWGDRWGVDRALERLRRL